MDDGTSSNADEALSPNIPNRTRGGAQILIDDTSKMIFINNPDGTSWMELTEDGNPDVYAQSDISIHTESDFNSCRGQTQHLQADKGVNIKSTGEDGTL